MQLQKKISEIEESMDKTETKLKTTTEEFNYICATGEDAERLFNLYYCSHG
jgi:hypothetical protein